MSSKLNAQKALIFRIVHKNNVPWILAHGMYCRNSSMQDTSYHTIGNPELIEKRRRRPVPIPPGGTLGDYIPFYFTPYTPMMYNIKTGYGGIAKVSNENVVIFVSSLYRLDELNRTFVFTNRHAYLFNAEFYNTVNDLDCVDWQLLQSRDFRRDPDDPEKIERYQAEALVHNHLPVDAFIGAVCYTDRTKDQLLKIANHNGCNLKIEKQTGWYL